MDKICLAQSVKYTPPPSQGGAFCSCVDADGLKHNPDDKSGIICKDMYVCMCLMLTITERTFRETCHFHKAERNIKILKVIPRNSNFIVTS